ncbi:enoyl-CoA hydratase-related protein [Pseudomonas sp. BF-R-19]|uniref:enoyl-CoA hydratase-related protein n=1 Tax=Pseudomonas sp. BF-R-19 TaxID=2832397 RepID=UPI001CBC0CD2|nr:enoyl-CoA hydratase-related protein [Pseudomonas sp. BF-R-19]
MKHIKLEISDRIATVTLNRPPVNALDAEAFREIAQVFTDLGRSTEASVVIFTAAGEKIFCAGVDLKDSARRHARQLTGDDTVADLIDPGAVPRECFEAIRNCPLPVIGAINGPAIGAGIPLAASCDILLASVNATFSVPEIKVGVLGGGRHLQRLVGANKTRRAFFTGDPIPATELYRLGAVEEVLAPEALMGAARELAAQIARNSPLGLRMGKESLNRVEDMPLEPGYRLEQDYTNRVSRLNDSSEARTAFQEKREPKWTFS